MSNQASSSLQAFTLSNNLGTKVRVLNYGAILDQITLTSPEGKEVNLLVSPEDRQEHFSNPFNMGKIVGRVAGRINPPVLQMNDQTYHLHTNNGNNCLHGGEQGIGNQFWEVIAVEDNYITLGLTVTTADDQFPGKLKIVVGYFLEEDANELLMYTSAHAFEGDTVFNPTNHAYWSLGHNSEQIAASRLTFKGCRWELDEQQLPVALDLRNKQDPIYGWQATVGEQLARLRQATGKANSGFDEVYHLEREGMDRVEIKLEVPELYEMIMTVEQPNLVVFTASPLDIPAHDRGEFNSIALEPQFLPNAPHNGQMRDIFLAEEQTVRYTTTYKFKLL